MGKGVFVTGTDTGCGKTEISLGLMQLLQTGGYDVLGMKPVASGSEQTPEGLRNADAARLRRQGSRSLPYDQINPYAFPEPVAPHLAAANAGVIIDLESLRDAYRGLEAQADFVIVEGVGGWRVPLGPESELPDLVDALNLPVILVVGIRLGCVNHTLLTLESVTARGVDLLGWVANLREPEMLELEANVDGLRERIPAPCLGRVPVLDPPSPQMVARYLSWPEAISPNNLPK